MIDLAGGVAPQVQADEVLARYILHSRYVRRSNGTVKPDAFVPHPHRTLSVTRHFMATEEELWSVGEGVAVAQEKTLHGRADICARTCSARQLRIDAAPVLCNPNHANVCGWPTDKPAQKMIAQELAAAAAYTARE